MTFSLWSPLHYFMIFFPFVLAVILYLIFKNRTTHIQKVVAIILGILMVGILLARSVYMIDKKGGLNPEAIPFQVCHFANFMMLLTALFQKNKVIGTIAWCLNFPAALVSCIFADSLVNYDTILNVQGIAYIAGHMLIVAGGLYMLLVNMIRIDRKSLKKAFYVLGVIYLLSILINNWFNKLFAHTKTDANYLYTYKPEHGTPLETLFNLGNNIDVLTLTFNPIYLILLAVVGMMVIYLMYGLYKLRRFFH